MSDTPEIKLVKTSRGSTYRMKKKEIVKVQKSNLTLPYEVGKLLRGLAMPQKKAYCLLLVEGSWTLQSIANELLCHRQTVLDYTRSKEAQDPDVLASVWDLPIPKLPRVVVGEVYEKEIVQPDADVLKRLLELQPLAQKVRSYSPKFREEAEEYTKLLADEIPLFELRRQDTKNRQNSINDITDETKSKWNTKIREHFSKAKAIYDGMIADGIAKECARFILPLATPTRLYMSGSVRSFIHWIALRSSHGTQKEHMELAEDARKIFIEHLPLVSEALGWK